MTVLWLAVLAVLAAKGEFDLGANKLSVYFSSIQSVLSSLRPWPLCYLLILLCAPVFILKHSQRRSTLKLQVLTGASILVSFNSVFLSLGLAVKADNHSYKQFAQEVRAHIPEGGKLVFLKSAKDESFDGFFFYYPNQVTLADVGSVLSPGVSYLTRASWLESCIGKSASERRDLHPENSSLREITRGGRKIDEPGEQVVLFTVNQQTHE